jgi:phospholipid-transporting ATPase
MLNENRFGTNQEISPRYSSKRPKVTTPPRIKQKPGLSQQSSLSKISDSTNNHTENSSNVTQDMLLGRDAKNQLETAQDLKMRVIDLGTEPKPKMFASNKVVTSKYNGLTWIPKSLLWQFRRVANVYFLIISVLTAMPFSPKNPFSMGATFAAVLIFTMFKEGYEDIVRHKQDSAINNAQVQKLSRESRATVSIKSQDLKVGDIIKVSENESFPADLIFLTSSDRKGVGFVNTMNLDGETNLKEKTAFEKTKTYNEADLSRLLGEVQCDNPSPSLVSWNCKIMINNSDTDWHPLAMNQLLLRGCVLKNTEFVYGLVIYTGPETKIMLNSKAPPSKISNVLKKMNTLLYSVFVFQAVICILFAGLSFNWKTVTGVDHEYLDSTSKPGASDFFIQILVFWVAYSHLVPISLYVSMEIVKLGQAFLIKNDVDMYYSRDDRIANVRSSDLIEELGQVEFIFSDKTGTLTCNEMEFKKCSVQGKVYKVPDIEITGKDKVTSRLKTELPQESARYDGILTQEAVKTNTPVKEFFKFMALCHSVFATLDKDNSDKPKYQAASPDELALVEISSSYKQTFIEREDSRIVIKEDGRISEWNQVVEVPFNSDRKRMSVVFQLKNDDYLLMTKGADSIMMKLISQYPQTSEEELKLHLDGFAREGLRTLVMAQKVIKKQEFIAWYKIWKDLMLSSAADKENRLMEHAKLIEKDLSLVGASAIEDKLQDEVPETIEKMLKANIRVWVLTGDKQETAIEIGKSCNMIQEGMKLIILSKPTENEVLAELNSHGSKYALDGLTIPEVLEYKLSSLNNRIALVIDGPSLAWIFDSRHSDAREKFFKLGLLADSCICCRVSPAQKASVVNLAHIYGKWITLSIGDGANDVNMIQTARIGVGISGKEGTQAVQASDFAIAQFKYLQKLVLVHGRWGYRRICWFICYFFYKNITVVFTELWFQAFSGFSGQIYYMDWLPMLYNSVWTSWPCILTYVFEQDLRAEMCIKYPNAYGAGQRNAYFTFKRFWVWVILAFVHGSICYWVPNIGLFDAPDGLGKNTGLFWISTTSFTLVIITVTWKLLIESFYWSWINL